LLVRGKYLTMVRTPKFRISRKDERWKKLVSVSRLKASDILKEAELVAGSHEERAAVVVLQNVHRDDLHYSEGGKIQNWLSEIY